MEHPGTPFARELKKQRKQGEQAVLSHILFPRELNPEMFGTHFVDGFFDQVEGFWLLHNDQDRRKGAARFMLVVGVCLKLGRVFPEECGSTIILNEKRLW